MRIQSTLPKTRPQPNTSKVPNEVLNVEANFVDPDQPVPKLDRPVLLIAGGSSKPVPLPETIHYLTKDSENSLGGIFHVDRVKEFEEHYQSAQGERNVFSLEYSRNFASFQHNATEIKKAITEIKRLTGAEEIDVVAECKGAMEVRQYSADVKEGEDGIRNLVMYVPPNHGLAVAGQVMWGLSKLFDKLPFTPDKVGQYTTDKDTLTAISSFNSDWELGPWKFNKTLSKYNSQEHRDKESRMFNSITVIAGEGRKLLQGKLGPGLPLPLMTGDQAIPNWSAYLPHAENFFYDGARSGHGHVKSHPEALKKMAETLTTDGNPTKDNAFSESQPGLKGVGMRSVSWVGSTVGRGLAAKAALTGATSGTAGTALMALGAGFAAWDGAGDLFSATKQSPDRLRLLGRGSAKLAQAAGVGMAMAGVGGWTSAALIGGGFLTSGLLNSSARF
jgi:hypothetical protein